MFDRRGFGLIKPSSFSAGSSFGAGEVEGAGEGVVMTGCTGPEGNASFEVDFLSSYASKSSSSSS